MTGRAAEPASGVHADAGSRRLPRPPAALLWGLLELFVLAGLVVAQPLLDVTGKAPDFFVFHRAGPGEILALVALIVVAPPAVLWLPEAAAQLVAGERGRRAVHLVLLAGLFAVLALEVGKKLTPVRGGRLVLAALVAGALVALVYARWPVVKLWLRYLAPAPLVFAMLFATTSPSSTLLLPSGSQGRATVPVRTDPARPLPPVVMVFFDEFPLQSLLDSHGRVDTRVYPNFARLAAGSTWYRNATGIAGFTPTAVPAMLTGRYPDKSRRSAAPVAQVYPDNLFTMFGHDYDLDVSETVTELCPPARCGQTGSRSGFATVARQTAQLYRNIASPVDVPQDPASIGERPSQTTGSQGATALFGNLGKDQAQRVDRFVAGIGASGSRPSLYFLHVLMPHAPWKHLPDGRVYADPVGRPVTKAGLWPEALTRLNHERHLLQLAYTDRLLGELLGRLRAVGLYDKALVVVTADHGSAFSPVVKSRQLGDGTAPTLVWVPLFIKAPGQTKGRVDDRNWEHVDLLPTVADMAGLTVPWKVDGFSETGPPRRLRSDKWWYEDPEGRRVVPGPPNFRRVLGGVTDTLVRAHQNGDKGFYQFGDTAGWVYRTLGQVGRVGGATLAARMKEWARFRTVTPGARRVPALVVGQLTSRVPPGATVVVTVNGTIAGTGGLYPAAEGERPTMFAAIVPDFLFTPGPGQRQIQAYLTTRTAGDVTFQPIRLSD